jgi:glycosyltransferase involved in cell wall biosynthesis/GT2 family glycosyltransferase
MTPLVSIVLPCHDGVTYLDEAVGSVVAQTEKDWELLLVDDGSTDETPERMRDWTRRDARIRLIALTPNRGLPAALNAGFRSARGAHFTWTSDDNLFDDGAIERMLERLEGTPTADVVYADYLRFDGESERRVRVGPIAALPLRNVIGACFLYRREVHEELGGFDESLFLAEDYDFWLRASSQFRFAAVHDVLYRYRDHGSSLTARRADQARAAAWRAAERHLFSLDPPLRSHVRMHWAGAQFAAGACDRARENVWCALAESPRAALPRAHRGSIARALLGRKLARGLERVLPRATTRPTARFVLPDALGGVASFVSHLATARPDDALPIEACWIERRGSRHASRPEALDLAVDRSVHVEHDWPAENLFSVLRRVRRAAPPGPGVLVASDFFGLALAAWRDPGRAVVQILHGDVETHYRLAERYGAHVDAFVAVSARIRDELRRRLPEREEQIHQLPSGVPIPERTRHATGGPLRLVYSGRFDRSKGVLDLPEIDGHLLAAGWQVQWTRIGAGPDEAALRRAFDGCPRVRFAGALTPAEVADHLVEQDVFVLPSRAEGLPLSLLEAMAAGVVPVSSNLASGVREAVEPGRSGFLAAVGDATSFADAIAQLARDRTLLERCSTAAVARVRARFDARERAVAFFDLLTDLSETPRPARAGLWRGPSRLDRPWLPNPLVRAIRGVAS